MTLTPNCPDLACGRPMVSTSPEGWICRRCETRILFASAERVESLRVQRGIEALRLSVASVLLAEGFRDWCANAAYYSVNRKHHGTYRLKATGRIAPWSKVARQHYPNNADFHEAAHAVCDTRFRLTA